MTAVAEPHPLAAPRPHPAPGDALAAAPTITCNGCSAHLPASAFDPSSIQQRKHRCRECRAQAQKLYRQSKRAVFLAANIRRQVKTATAGGDPVALQFSAADAIAALDRYGGQCILTGEKDITKLTLVRLRHDVPLCAENVAPVAKALVMRSVGHLLCRIMAAEAEKKRRRREDTSSADTAA